MVQLFLRPTLDANCRSARLRRAIAELFGHDELFSTTDRVSFNQPDTDSWKSPGPRLNWGLDFNRPIGFGLRDAQNGSNDTQGVKVTVSPRSREVFAYTPMIVPANRVAVPAP
jgi:hypothetical protein